MVRKHLFGCRGGGKVLFSRNAKPGMFGLGIVLKEIFIAYSTQFVFLAIRLAPGNVVIVALDMCGKSPITGEWMYGFTWKHVSFNISVLFYCRYYFYFKISVFYCLLFMSWWFIYFLIKINMNNKMGKPKERSFINELLRLIFLFFFYRRSCLEVFCKKYVLKSFTKFTGKHLCQSLFFNKVAVLRPAKKKTLAQMFSYKFCEIFKST